jgi:hypothetical protein
MFATAIDRTDHYCNAQRSLAISLKLFQNSSSRLILVLCPAMMIERFKTRYRASSPGMSPRYYDEQATLY